MKILAFFFRDLGHIFESNVGNEFGVMMREKRLQKPELLYDIVCILSIKLYRDLIECNIVGDMKAPLLRFLFLLQSSMLETL